MKDCTYTAYRWGNIVLVIKKDGSWEIYELLGENPEDHWLDIDQVLTDSF